MNYKMLVPKIAKSICILWVIHLVVAQIVWEKTGYSNPTSLSLIEMGTTVFTWYLWFYLIPRLSWKFIKAFPRLVWRFMLGILPFLRDPVYMRNTIILIAAIYLKSKMHG